VKRRAGNLPTQFQRIVRARGELSRAPLLPPRHRPDVLVASRGRRLVALHVSFARTLVAALQVCACKSQREVVNDRLVRLHSTRSPDTHIVAAGSPTSMHVCHPPLTCDKSARGRQKEGEKRESVSVDCQPRTIYGCYTHRSISADWSQPTSHTAVGLPDMISDNKLDFQLNFTFYLPDNSEYQRRRHDRLPVSIKIRHTNNNIKMPVFYGF